MIRKYTPELYLNSYEKRKIKLYVHLGKIIMILAKMIVHFSIRFSVQFSLVRLFTFDISLVLILVSFFIYGYSLSSGSLFPFVSPGSSAWTVVVQPPSFVSSQNTRGPPKMRPNVAVPVKTSAGTRLYYALIKQLLQYQHKHLVRH